MTNEELWLTARLGRLLGVHPDRHRSARTGAGDDILLSEDRNP